MYSESPETRRAFYASEPGGSVSPPLSTVVAPFETMSTGQGSPSPSPRKSSFSFIRPKRRRTASSGSNNAFFRVITPKSSSGNLAKKAANTPPAIPPIETMPGYMYTPPSRTDSSESAKPLPNLPPPTPVNTAGNAPPVLNISSASVPETPKVPKANDFAQEPRKSVAESSVRASQSQDRAFVSTDAPAPPTEASTKRQTLQVDTNVDKSGEDALATAASGVSSAMNEAFGLANSKKELSKGQQKFDKIVEGATGAFDKVNSFYTSNADMLTTAQNALSGGNAGFEQAIGQFADVAKTVCTGLDALSNLHPFVGIACQAFKLVISFDLQRRENNKKCFVVKLQMQELMVCLFQLRNIRDPKDKGPDGQTIEGRMQGLMKRICASIKEAGSAIDLYLGKGLVSKTLKCKKYQAMLTDQTKNFENYKKEIDFALTMHTAVGVDNANRKLDDQSAHMKELESKLDKLFSKLDTPRERSMIAYIGSKGGAQSVVSDSDALQSLFNKSGESLAAYAGGKRGKTGSDTMENVQMALGKELQESLKAEMGRNFERFEGKLSLMETRLAGTIHAEGDRVISALSAGAHNKILDQDLQNIWKDMAWKGTSVKARHFILALHDYFVEKIENESNAPPTDKPSGGDTSTAVTPVAQTAENATTEGAAAEDNSDDGSSSSSEEPSDEPNFKDPEEAKRLNHWALSFLNVSHVQSILEAIDDDGTGFISVKEVNQFVFSRPPGWSLPYWLAYWAIGWHASITIYRGRIYSQLQEMFQKITSIHSSNRTAAESYLDSSPLMKIDQLLRSTAPLENSFASDQDLKTMLNSYLKNEEERLDAALKSVKYYVEKQSVSLITGPGRIERYIFPLIYVMLKQHNRLLDLACKYKIHASEFDYAWWSLAWIFEAVTDRIDNLEAVFKQTHSDVSGRFGNFAYGMFEKLYTNGEDEDERGAAEIPDYVADGDFANWDYGDDSESSSASSGSDEDASESGKADPDDPSSVLFYGAQACFDGFDDESQSDAEEEGSDSDSDSDDGADDVDNILSGSWSGHCLYLKDGKHVSSQGPLEITIWSSWYLTFEGWAQSWSGKMDTRLEGSNPSLKSLDVNLTLSYDDGYSISGKGKLDLTRDVIVGTWEVSNESSQLDHEGFLSGEADQPDNNDEDSSETTSEDASGGEEEEDGGDMKVVIEGEQEDESEHEKSEDEKFYESLDTAPRVFYLTRTPASLLNFRYSAEEFEKSPARARWRFALGATLKKVQLSRLTTSRILDRFSERKHFVEIATKAMLQVREPIEGEEVNETDLGELKAIVYDRSPLDGRFYHSLTKLEMEKTVRIRDIWCDSCERQLARERYVCVDCVNEAQDDILDLCLNCLNQSAEAPDRGFTHEPSHSIVTWKNPSMHNMYVRSTITPAIEVVDRTRKYFKSVLQAMTQASTDDEDQSSEDEPRCACCESKLLPPCWACVECSDCYVCFDCFSKKEPPSSSGSSPYHDYDHAMVRVSLVEDKSSLSIDEQMDAMEKRLVEAFNEKFTALETKVDERLSAMYTMLERISDALVTTKKS